MKLNLLLITLLIVSLVSIGVLIDNSITDKSNIERLQENLNNKGKDIEVLKLSERELRRNELKHNQEMDSVLRLLKVKPKQIISYQQVVITNTIKDTSTVAFKDTIPIVDSLYVLPFERATECLSVSGRVLSTDLNTKLYFDSIKSNNTVYIVKSYKKTFWDYILFRNGKEVIQIEEKCGESTIKSIEMIK